MANVENLGRVAAGLAAVVGVLYVVGAVIIGVRLGMRDLPSTAVVAQLPREFLLSTGLNVILPAPAVAVAVYVAFVLATKRSRTRLVRNAVVLASCAAVASAGYYILKDPFPAKVCSPTASAVAAGDFIGETGQRVYIGELRDGSARLHRRAPRRRGPAPNRVGGRGRRRAGAHRRWRAGRALPRGSALI